MITDIVDAVWRHPARRGLRGAGLLAVLACLVPVPGGRVHAAVARGSSYDALVRLFAEWRAFQRPPLTDGVPDYGAAAMHAQQEALPKYQQRLAAIDTAGWTVPQRVDWHIVRAEMHGLEFDHRVRRPWATNPAFYATVFADRSDQPAREGPFAWGAVELWSYRFPLSAGDAAAVDAGLVRIPALLAQAKANLTGDGHDLWVWGAKAMEEQAAALRELEQRLGADPALAAVRRDAGRAREATEAFAAWVAAQAPAKTGPSGVGIAQFDWYMTHVQLVPYTWRDEVALMDRELARAQSSLAIEELRNAKLPPQVPVASAAEFDRRFGAAVTEYMQYLQSHDVMTIRPYMDSALRSQVGHFTPGPREFFTEVDYRDPVVMRTHGYHWFDLARQEHEPPASPIRREPLLYNMFITRTEGNATGWEERMLQLGLFDARPRSRELIWILLAERAARAMGELRMQSNEATLEQAARIASEGTPRGWLSLSGSLVRSEQHLYLQQPGYGPGYVVGKLIIDRLLATRRRQLGDAFTMRRFMDEFNAAGMIPASLLEWELTGELRPELAAMLSER